jgi:hypothetical protein
MSRPTVITWVAALVAALALAGGLGCDRADDGGGSPEPVQALGSPARRAEDPIQPAPGFLAVLTAKRSADVVAPFRARV